MGLQQYSPANDKSANTPHALDKAMLIGSGGRRRRVWRGDWSIKRPFGNELLLLLSIKKAHQGHTFRLMDKNMRH